MPDSNNRKQFLSMVEYIHEINKAHHFVIMLQHETYLLLVPNHQTKFLWGQHCPAMYGLSAKHKASNQLVQNNSFNN